MAYDAIPAAHIAGVALTTSETVYFIASEQGAGIGDIDILNTHTENVTVSIWAIPSGGSSGVSNALLLNFDCIPGIPQNFAKRRYINPGTQIAAKASVADVVSLAISGVVVTK